MQVLNKAGFFEMGFPYYGLASVNFQRLRPQIAKKIWNKSNLYSEDGEEYGGTNKSEETYLFSPDYIKEIYYEGGYEKVIKKLTIRK